MAAVTLRTPHVDDGPGAPRSAADDDTKELLRDRLMAGTRKSSPNELTRRRRRTEHRCWDHLIVAPLWVAYAANLGTLLRTCDAAGACLAAPRTPHYREALARGNTLPGRSCVHWVSPSKEGWLREQRALWPVWHRLANGRSSCSATNATGYPTSSGI